MPSKKKVLVVAGRIADSPDLMMAMHHRAGRSPVVFTLLVPAVPRGFAWAADMKAGWSDALSRAERVAILARKERLELEETIVGDPDPFAAIGDVLHARDFDEVAIAVLPRGVSRWVTRGLIARVRRVWELPVTELSVNSRRERGHQPKSRVAA